MKQILIITLMCCPLAQLILSLEKKHQVKKAYSYIYRFKHQIKMIA